MAKKQRKYDMEYKIQAVKPVVIPVMLFLSFYLCHFCSRSS